MENLNAEQIKKALECCSSSDDVSACESGCPYWCGDYDTCPCIEEPNFIVKNALALINSQEQRIKELGEENERLKKDNEYILMQHAFQRRPSGDCWNDVIEKAKADTVKKMHSMLCEGRVSNDNVVIVANQVLKEMLEGK